MFKIQGTDQKEYGPVTADVMRQWIGERRVDGRTLIQAEGTTVWKPLAEFPEFAAALSTMRPPPAVAAPVSLPPAGAARTSGTAVASLVLGILGCLGITAIVGLVLGIVSLVSINKSQGRLKGGALAIAGICLSGFMLLMVPVLLALTLPALAQAKGKAQTINCVSNLKQLGLACRMYANDYKDAFPNPTTWCDDIMQYAVNPRVYRCNAEKSPQQCHYGFNAKLAGKKDGEVNPQTVMLFETTGGWNVNGGPESMLPAARHRSVINIGFADGSVQQVPVNRLSTLRWDP